MQTRRFTRSMINRTFGGVCGGLGDYLNISAWWVRAIFVIFSIFTAGVSVGIYVVLWLTIPAQTLDDLQSETPQTTARAETYIVLGAGVVLLGIAVLAVSLGVLQGTGGDILLPFVIIALGMVLLYQQLRSAA